MVVVTTNINKLMSAFHVSVSFHECCHNIAKVAERQVVFLPKEIFAKLSALTCCCITEISINFP